VAVKTFMVTKKVTITYEWIVEADTASEAVAMAEDMGTVGATEAYTTEGKPKVERGVGSSVHGGKSL
jgi:hypothetical protein